MTQDLKLLTTKLHIPATRRPTVVRPRLLEQLNQTLSSRLTLLSAPAGFGKTTSLTEWLAIVTVKGVKVGWVSLDEGDQDPLLFWMYVIAALDNVTPGLKGALIPLLQTSQVAALESILTSLINWLEEVAGDFLLVLDDYHYVNNPVIHKGVMFLLERQPSQMHLIITSRADPPLHLPRLRVRGQLTELRAEDLRFTLEETTTFLNQMMGIELSVVQMQALEERTEGWIAGLQLAALSMQKRHDLDNFVAAFTASHRYMLDYVLEEVLEQQSPSIQAFLLQTAVLSRLNGALCEAVTGQPNGQALLERLERANMFLIPLDEKRGWYRYHHLFADLLLFRLQQLQPEQVPKLYRHAGRWCQQHNLLEEAVNYYLKGAHFEQAVSVLEQLSRLLVVQGRLTRLLDWVEQLPTALVSQHPRLCVACTWAGSLSGKMEVAEAFLNKAVQALEAIPCSHEKHKDLWGEIATYQTTIITSYQRDFRQALSLSRQALADLPEADLFLRTRALRNMGEAYLLNDNLEAAAEAYREGVKVGLTANDNYMACAAAYGLGITLMLQGDLQAAEDSYCQLLQHYNQNSNFQLPVTSYLHLGLADIHYERNNLEKAHAYVQKALELAQQGGLTSLLIWGYTTATQIKQALGDKAGALTAHTDCQPELQKYKPAHYHIREKAAFTRVLLLQGQLDTAIAWAEQYISKERAIAQNYAYGLQEYLNLTLVRVWLAQGQTEQTGHLLDQLLERAQSTCHVSSLIEIKALQAAVLAKANKPTQAMVALREALQLAEAGGFVHLLVDLGSYLIPLLHALHRSKADTARLNQFIAHLLVATGKPFAKFNAPDEIAIVLPEPNGLNKPLTERELEVLRLVSLGQTPPLIAQTLVISLDTVKKHIKNIYLKLDAHSRFEAVVRAKELKLVGF